MQLEAELTQIRLAQAPIFPSGGLAVLKGNLAPRGALIKHASATPALLQHRGRAVVFDGLEDLANRIDRDDLDVNADDVLVLSKGEAVEQGSREELFSNPKHPYTQQLFAATPVTDVAAIRARVERRAAARAAR